MYAGMPHSSITPLPRILGALVITEAGRHFQHLRLPFQSGYLWLPLTQRQEGPLCIRCHGDGLKRGWRRTKNTSVNYLQTQAEL